MVCSLLCCVPMASSSQRALLHARSFAAPRWLHAMVPRAMCAKEMKRSGLHMQLSVSAAIRGDRWYQSKRTFLLCFFLVFFIFHFVCLFVIYLFVCCCLFVSLLRVASRRRVSADGGLVNNTWRAERLCMCGDRESEIARGSRRRRRERRRRQPNHSQIAFFRTWEFQFLIKIADSIYFFSFKKLLRDYIVLKLWVLRWKIKRK